MKLNILLFDTSDIIIGTSDKPVLHYKLEGSNLDKKSMGISQLLLHKDYGILFSGKGYNSLS